MCSSAMQSSCSFDEVLPWFHEVFAGYIRGVFGVQVVVGWRAVYVVRALTVALFDVVVVVAVRVSVVCVVAG